MSVDEMLRDLRSVKVRPTERVHVDALRVRFQALGKVTSSDERWLRDICRRYAMQLKMLHESRDRARHTNAMRSMGITSADVESHAVDRLRRMDADENDMGF
jgi:hypothetical protein